MQVARDTLHKALGDAFERRFRQFRNCFIRIAYRTDPKRSYPSPLPGTSRERTIHDRVCDPCGLRYAAFGKQHFCPVRKRLERL